MTRGGRDAGAEMRGVVLTAGAVVAAVLLVGCGGGAGDGASEPPRPSGGGASASPVEESTLSRRTVRRDVWAAAAAGGFGDIDDRGGTPAPCRLIAAVRTDDEPEPAALAKVVAELKDRGWEQVFRKAEDDGAVTWFLKRANWGTYVITRTASEQESGGPAFSFSGVRLDCPSGAATASP
ncbi:hypothetical protein [Streptomyces sporangiiformans]|uniref:Uncharacterized protein n=1 Tax=Streptomyces sporangiiformans TaxID=2315329 RepID=A0A505DJR6_9ACTN|nr:hypothetical protein [Streptomyces sporangiiformans]TPQ17891.1 hypothetical protein FGD71_034120 [Streptomyces sporangiiformans]